MGQKDKPKKKKKWRERDTFAEVTGGQADADDEEIRDNVMKKQPIREGGEKRHSCLQLWKGHNRLVESQTHTHAHKHTQF